MRRRLRALIKNLPYLRWILLERDRLVRERDRLADQRDSPKGWLLPGHFYSPIPSLQEVRARDKEIFGRSLRELPIPAVDLNVEGQVALFEEFGKYYKEMPFEPQKKEGLRYYFENPSYSYGDAIVLYCMIRHAQPKRIVEAGSGFSSCVILDTNELFFSNAISLTCIDPYPQQLLSLIRDNDKEKLEVIAKRLQEVDLGRFSELSAGDILFIDSTHVSKIDSDVNYIFFRILPHLNSGVYIQFHDIFHPFEYPRDWIYEGKAWNEAYVLRAFLQYNSAFKVVFFNSFLGYFYKDELIKEMPLWVKDAGSSIWLQKL